jgi:Holliday junction resolvase-like predicted endonuclease
VIRLLEKNGWSLQFHRLQTTISEIDIIMGKDLKIILIEVKKLDDDWRAFQRISVQQKNKMKLNEILFSYHFKDFIYESFIAWVDPKNRISFCKNE